MGLGIEFSGTGRHQPIIFAQTIVKHYRARNAARADAGIDRLVLQVRKEGLAG